ncbi:TIGR02391 family protein [Curtobacterium sp. TC1]|uniref:TIGR02391 family protein n=1 Tax=Curtobacterium sp. TC1 TaxID=2862880 RepID=UPI001C9A35A3|nr:TIGR02391 family protein [Curtobacterium sp. TC1]QZQ56821.1 TIGR02391 family protein [Curtobacterium sp. TC1]
MSGLNNSWAAEQLTAFIHMTECVVSSSPGVFGSFARGREEDIARQAQVVAQDLDRATPQRRGQVIEGGRRWQGLRQAASRGLAQIDRAQELDEMLADDAPRISAADIHPWIWSGARSFWQSGHVVQTVRDAVTKLNAETQNKVGRQEVSETDLLKQSFSLDEAKPGRLRLRRIPPEDSDTYRSAQRGAMAFAEGVFAGIRNPLSHEADQELTEQVALEYLVALSVLARWVDDSLVKHAGGV